MNSRMMLQFIAGNVRFERDAEDVAEILQGRDGRDGRDGLAGPQGPPGQDCCSEPHESGGVTYVRWGRTVCPGTELVYTGTASGSRYSVSGGGGNYQCLPDNPENLAFGPGTSTSSHIYGAE